jgi:hypothetical protein
MRKMQCLVCLVLVLALCRPLPALAEDFAVIEVGSTTVRWDVRGDFESVVLTVSQPNTKVYRKEIRAGEPVGFEVDASAKDGVYTWQLLGIPRFDDSVRKELAAARLKGNECEVIERLQDAGQLPRDTAVQSGAFSVVDGTLVQRIDEDTALKTSSASRQPAPRHASGGGPQIITAADQVIPDDLIVQGSACIGFDCVNNENFGFDTIRLKENNLRIKFEDTSVGTFPTNDWQLTANDSASGGASKFSIEDITGAKVPFTIRAGAATNSVFVDSTGRVGFRTSTPVLDLHVATSNTPALRLEQNSSGGFTAQTWDIAGNEANFFVRDVTGGSRLPFRIRPGAPTSSIDISADGDVGVGTASPSSSFHVSRSDGTAKILIEENSGANASRELLELKNLGGVAFILDDESDPSRWTTTNQGSNYLINNQANGGIEFTLSSTGNLTTLGTVNGVSDRNMKKDIFPVRREDILAKLAALPIATWSYKTEDIRHMGPMAQDFAAAFGLGVDDKHIALTDMAGVTMAAVQALHEQVNEKDAEINGLKQQNADLEKRLATLEALVTSLAAGAQK